MMFVTAHDLGKVRSAYFFLTSLGEKLEDPDERKRARDDAQALSDFLSDAQGMKRLPIEWET